MPQTQIKCKVCGSLYLVKDGTFKGNQKWECRSCGKKFIDNSAPPGMKTPAVQIGTAVHLYYEGLSLKAICKRLNQTYHSYPSDSAVYAWINVSTDFVVERAKDFHPKVGDTWIVIKTALKVEGYHLSIVDVLDMDTRFLLASQVFKNGNTYDIHKAVQKAGEKANKNPMVVLSGNDATVANGEYDKGYSSTFDTFHEMLKHRSNKINALKSEESVIRFANGWLIHYNYFKPQEELNWKTPADLAKISYRHKNLDNSTVIVLDHLVF